MRVRWEVIMLFCHSCIFVVMEDERSFAPCPPIVSFHPASIVFRRNILVSRGYFMMNWEERGVRNHIEAERW